MVKRDNGVTSFVLCSISKLLSTQETIQRYQRHTKAVQTDNSSVEENMQHLKHEAADMAKQIELLEVAKRKLLGEDLGSCTMEELQQIEQQLERSVSRVRAKKMEAFMEQIDQLKEKEKVLTAENAKLCEKGTTANGIPLISFQLGAFIPGYPVQPVIVRYPHVYFDQSWGNVTLAMLMFRMFMQFHNFMEVEYIPVVSPLENQKENAIHFAKRDRTGHAIATALNVVQTGHVYGDFMLFAKAAESKQDIVYFGVESQFGSYGLPGYISFHESRFQAGHVKIHDFSRVLRLKACGLSEKIFGILDVEKRGKITFKQFVYGSAHVLKQPLFRQACELAFTECYVDGNHYISEQE
ncbi:unnamed protein product [Camellia sinensis]